MRPQCVNLLVLIVLWYQRLAVDGSISYCVECFSISLVLLRMSISRLLAGMLLWLTVY